VLVLEPVPAPVAEASRADEYDAVVGVLAYLVSGAQGVGEEPRDVVLLLAVSADAALAFGEGGGHVAVEQGRAGGAVG
jgi:hypothetical protein